MSEYTAYIGLGSNLGDREACLAQARARLADLPGTEVVTASGIYETSPVGVLVQPDFLNQVVEIRTTLSPHDLLAHLKRIERDLGRRPGLRWGPREIDLDILLIPGVEVCDEDLCVPHPRLAERAFALIPLAELAPDVRVAGVRTAAELAQALRRSQRVEPINACAAEEQ